jgi:hypothetical protein
MKNSEHLEQVALFRWMWANRAKHVALEMAFAIPNGGARHIVVARKLKAEGVKPGVPDIFIPWLRPMVGKIYGGLFIEMKSKKGKPSLLQTGYLGALSSAGYGTAVCYSWIEAAKIICDYLGIDPASTGLR